MPGDTQLLNPLYSRMCLSGLDHAAAFSRTNISSKHKEFAFFHAFLQTKENQNKHLEMIKTKANLKTI